MDRYKGFIMEKLKEASGIEDITEDSLLFEEEILDSLSILYFISETEEQYGIQIPLEDVVEGNFCSVKHIAAYLHGRLAHCAADE